MYRASRETGREREAVAGVSETDLSAHALRRRTRRRRWALANLAADVAMLGLAVAASSISSAAVDVPLQPTGWIAAHCILVLVLLRVRGLYALRLDPSLLDDVARILGVTAAAAMTVITLRVITESTPDVARQTLRLWAFSAVYLSAGRAGLAIALRRSRRKGEGGQNAIIVGGGRVGQTIARRLLDKPDIGLWPVAFIDKDPMPSEQARPGAPPLAVPVLGASWDLERIVVQHDVRYAILGFSTAPHQVMLSIVRRCQALGVGVLMVPRLFEGVNNRIYVDHLGGLPILAVRPVDPRGWQFTVKHLFDRVAASILILAASPLLVACALAVRVSSPGPILFRQRRVGRDGREFDVLKFRTMTGDPRESGEADRHWAADVLGTGQGRPTGRVADERRTRVGTFMRRRSLDELPQLFNVLKGEMSLVGPRPERTSYARAFEDHVHRYGDRHRVKSGISGWAQVHGLRGRTSLADRIEWDNFYIENWSLSLDLKILAMTVAAVLRKAD